MRILHLHDRLSARGGADRHLLALLDALQGRATTLLAVGRDDQSLPPAERAALGPWRRVKGLDRSGLAPRGGEAARRRLTALAAEFRPELIHVHNLMDPGLLALAPRLAPAVMTMQDHRLVCPGRGMLRPDGAACEAPLGPGCPACLRDPDYAARLTDLTRARLAALAGFRGVITLSRYMAGLLARAGGSPGWVAVLPPFPQGLDPAPDEAPAGPGDYHLLACRLVGAKGVRVALAAARLLAGGLPLVVAGDGGLAGEVARAAERSGGRLRWAGWADRPAMRQLLAGARSVWLPSLWAEPFGIVGLEALSLGRPVVASRVGGVADWLREGENGLLVPPGDPAALAGAADRLAGDPALAAALGRAGARLVREEFAPAPLMARLLGLYQRAVGTSGPVAS
ncbi:MAG: glycosyltransferase family 4 protein [Deltaproteobacteria bacterium]|nr:glycosyltransferase family 4 protein [Deltaproteobacteria bacterium]